MKTAIIVHGMPSREDYFSEKNDSQSNSHWLPWLQQQLNIHGILSQTPEMPEPYAPDYEKWKSIFEQFILDEETILVGHSCSGGFIVKYLSEHTVKVNKVILVAPWINTKREDNITMFDTLKIDEDLTLKTNGVTIFSSSNDDVAIKNSIDTLVASIKNIKVVEFKNYGHFCYADMGIRSFPELLEEILK